MVYHCDFLNYRARFFNQNLTADTATNARGVRSGNSRYYSFEIPGLLHVAGIRFLQTSCSTNG